MAGSARLAALPISLPSRSSAGAAKDRQQPGPSRFPAAGPEARRSDGVAAGNSSRTCILQVQPRRLVRHAKLKEAVAMVDIADEVIVHAPAERVWKAIADPGEHVAWHP